MILRRSRSLVVALVAAMTLAACTISTDGQASPGADNAVASDALPTAPVPTDVVPVLGRERFERYAVGFGTVRPTSISIASTASSTVGDITWESWGGDEAVGHGTSQQNGPQNPKDTIWVRASDPGWCDGKWAYRALQRAGSRAALVNATAVDDICKGDRAAPTSSSATLTPSSPLTFGGAGGVFVGDNKSAIPATYLAREMAGLGVYQQGTEFFYFAPKGGKPIRQIRTGPDGVIEAFDWDRTDRGIEIGATKAEVEKAYDGVPSATCSLYPSVYGLFFTDPVSKRIILFVMNDDKVTHIKAARHIVAGEHCPFE